MGFVIKSDEYVDILVDIAKRLDQNKDYITELDSITGDGDHWANMNMGFQKIIDDQEQLKALELAPLFKKIGMVLMSTIGGSSGVLYGSAYIATCKAIDGEKVIDANVLATIYLTSVQAIMDRGKAEPGFKTMIDTLHPAAHAYKNALDAGKDESECLDILVDAAQKGMESTKEMVAVKGRATYQANKGVGHLDPGAVTMYYQIDELVKYIKNK